MIPWLFWLIFLGFLSFYLTMSWALLYHVRKFGLKADPASTSLIIVFVIGSLALIVVGIAALLNLDSFFTYLPSLFI